MENLPNAKDHFEGTIFWVHWIQLFKKLRKFPLYISDCQYLHHILWNKLKRFFSAYFALLFCKPKFVLNMLCTGTLERLAGSNNAHQVLSLAPFHSKTCMIRVFVNENSKSFIFFHFEVLKHQSLNLRTCGWIFQRSENIFLCLIFIRLEVTRCFDSYLTSHWSTK